jgi:hypothetical protein
MVKVAEKKINGDKYLETEGVCDRIHSTEASSQHK